MNKTQKKAIKAQNRIEVFFSEKLQVFYVKGKRNHEPTQKFKALITCEHAFFNEFLTFLEQFKSSKELKTYKFLELKDKLNDFLINNAANLKNTIA
ncbi:hypothetical protein [Tenacibaculum finnmarkense]|uniref:hypothetical protein n=1 Tax=Tenacibaculum finnmarkense TaxID=2781243 RepID=UPI001EFB1508|nr:hypothetical protein [Tenacibaculum finnmarkense]MCG8207226.1 hypothetical protein [Tenacibaculum finnmarkense genomovar finnmarkense]MCG8723296.1 hypothetical protein [Tenacibaculum finnmarkense]MCG8741663.1 hypothetical protein [Tenacibaculum finnmarkense]MCG8764960.1 hypothetical protein [Tenacibaculum finnmarkense]MCG8777824.1 hypothetical protein [Tenacibaculum finnmarkense]